MANTVNVNFRLDEVVKKNPDFITKKIKFNLERLNSRYFFDFFQKYTCCIWLSMV